MKSILVIAGSDSCGGAGIQADIKAAYKLRYHAMTVISALTAQNTVKVADIMPVPEEFISKQLHVVLEDVMPDAVKIGMLFSTAAIKVVSDVLSKKKLFPVVLDPLLRASTGAMLLKQEGILCLKRLFPQVDVITPNIYEAGLLSGIEIKHIKDVEKAALVLHKTGAKKVIITGFCSKDKIIDVGYDGKDFFYIEDKPLLSALHSHGSGCVYSTSLAIFLAEGYSLKQAASLAHKFTMNAIRQGYPLGKGSGPVCP
ncbi:MAG: bifunctional hydroxymethylpyrimidine kinase/phosphomethylpyrimidine kinase [Deltaproteobacteria bacterium]|nr:MAG: bifunctional hydroxymethylpyrimidine kinase/phosphomethylpyrimidine kinase [Deltaproteobacteria bacterium]